MITWGTNKIIEIEIESDSRRQNEDFIKRLVKEGFFIHDASYRHYELKGEHWLKAVKRIDDGDAEREYIEEILPEIRA